MTRFSPVPTTTVPTTQTKTYLDRKLERLVNARTKIQQQLNVVLKEHASVVVDYERVCVLVEANLAKAVVDTELASAATLATRREIEHAQARLQRLVAELAERAREEADANRLREAFELERTTALDALAQAAAPFVPHRLALEKDIGRLDTRIALTRARFPRIADPRAADYIAKFCCATIVKKR